jgi:hypothetical protein
MIADVSGRLTGEFADCLQARIGAPEASEAEGPNAQVAAEAAPAAKPIGGLRLGLWAIWRAIVRFFRRLGQGIGSLFRRG